MKSTRDGHLIRSLKISTFFINPHTPQLPNFKVPNPNILSSTFLNYPIEIILSQDTTVSFQQEAYRIRLCF